MYRSSDCDMSLERNEYVVFPNGERHGYLECRWSEKAQAFFTFDEETGEKIFSTKIEVKERKSKKAPFVPSPKTCTKPLFPERETEKCYITTSAYGKLKGGAPSKTWYHYTAKSICWVDENGNIYAPVWADIGDQGFIRG